MQTLKITKKENHDSLWIKVQVIVDKKPRAEIVTKVTRGGLSTKRKFFPDAKETAEKISKIMHDTMSADTGTYGELMNVTEAKLKAL